MAGWTSDRLAQRQRDNRSDADPSRPDEGSGVAGHDANRASAATACSVAQLIDKRRPLPARDPRPANGGPHLVSVNHASQEAQLQRIVELEIIPRLMLMHAEGLAAPAPSHASLLLTDEHVDTLARLAVERDAGVAGSYVQALINAGATQEQIFLDLLTPCARLLGRLWDDDSYDFSQVTVGLWRLQQVLYEQSRPFLASGGRHAEPFKALLSPVPGSQHTFGVTMVAEFFTRAGWDLQCINKATWLELQNMLASQWVDMVGLSIGVIDMVGEVSSAILGLREASVNPDVFVMVGGAAAALMPDLAARCGADAMAMDAASALEVAQRWAIVKRIQA